jgi:HSP20 family protein
MWKIFQLFTKKNKSEEQSDVETHEKKVSKYTEEVIAEPYLYIHKEPKTASREEFMPMRIEQPDSDPNGNGMMSYADEHGRVSYVDPRDAERISKGDVPDGVDIPGLGHTSNQKPNQPHIPRPRPPQQRQQIPIQQNHQPQQNMQPQQPVAQQPRPQPRPQQKQQPVSSYPFVEIAALNDSYFLFMDLPGVKKDTLSIKYDGSNITVSGIRISSLEIMEKEKAKKRNRKILNKNITVPDYLLGKFEFKFPFKKRIDEAKILAKFEDGILNIELPFIIKLEHSVPIV